VEAVGNKKGDCSVRPQKPSLPIEDGLSHDVSLGGFLNCRWLGHDLPETKKQRVRLQSS
jgi:hypothetical protein